MSEDDDHGGATDERAVPFRDAVEWLRQQGIEREPIQVSVPEADGSAGRGDTPERPPSPEPAVGTTQAPSGPTPSDADGGGSPEADVPEGPEEPGRLEDEISQAVAFARRSTAGAPQSEGRLAGKMAEKGWPPVVVEQALERCRERGIVDDQALARSLVEEGRRKGHARRRLARDLRRRDLDQATIDAALEPIEDEDQQAAASELAAKRARELTHVDEETAFRRIVGYLVRRGHGAGRARRVARQALFDRDGA